ncbi:MAG: hypothetical protein AB1Z23_04345 [Eubacteriales bacterium]
MNGGLFITLYDEKTLTLYLKYGIYGFLMKPVFGDQPATQSRHYQALADYACSREGAHVFFFLKRKIVYGGRVKGNTDIASFYLNGDSSPMGRKANAELFWDESDRYKKTDKNGVFKVDGNEKAQPYILMFDEIEELTGKYISSDDLYFELGQYPFPLPSNSIQGMSFCTLTPGETEVALEQIEKNGKQILLESNENMALDNDVTIFNKEYLDNEYINEAHLEFSILADLSPLFNLINNNNYILCRQVPISPFKPFNMDRADICLYDIEKPINNGTVPNIIIELKKQRANFHAYEQVVRYLKWLEKITNEEEFKSVKAIIVAESFFVNPQKIDLRYNDMITMYSYKEKKIYNLKLGTTKQ